jgi:hypothetical protein
MTENGFKACFKRRILQICFKPSHYHVTQGHFVGKRDTGLPGKVIQDI